MLIRNAVKFRIYPNETQKANLAIQFGHARFVYNYYNALRDCTYDETGKTVPYTACAHHVVTLKRDPEHQWLKQADSQVLQQKLTDLDWAYQNFFRMAQAGTLAQGGTPRKDGKPTGYPKYFISIQCEVDVLDPDPGPRDGDRQVGVDLGLKDFATLSTGEKFNAPKHLGRAERRLKIRQRRLSRKQKGSNSRETAHVRVAKQHEKVANQRTDFHHKLSHEIVERFSSIVFEDLNVTVCSKTAIWRSPFRMPVGHSSSAFVSTKPRGRGERPKQRIGSSPHLSCALRVVRSTRL